MLVLCSRHARPQKGLIRRAHSEIDQYPVTREIRELGSSHHRVEPTAILRHPKRT